MPSTSIPDFVICSASFSAVNDFVFTYLFNQLIDTCISLPPFTTGEIVLKSEYHSYRNDEYLQFRISAWQFDLDPYQRQIQYIPLYHNRPSLRPLDEPFLHLEFQSNQFAYRRYSLIPHKLYKKYPSLPKAL